MAVLLCPYFVRGSAPPVVDMTDPGTALVGAQHRQLCVRTRPDRGQLRSFRAFVHNFLRDNIARASVNDVPDFETFLSTTSYTEAEKIKLREARLVSDATPPFHLKKKHIACKSFIKDEKYDDFKHARGICGRSLVIRSRYGPLIQAVERKVFPTRWFVKGLAPQARAKLIASRFSGAGLIIENDFESFESSFSSSFISACEVQLFKWVLGDAVDPLLLAEMCADATGLGQFVTRMVYRHFTATVKGRRKSGDSHTSLANGFSNLMLFLFSAQQSSIPLHLLDVVVEGDDSIAIIPEGSNFLFEKIVGSLGFVAKMNIRPSLRSASFCQTFVDPEVGCIRDASKVLLRFPWSRSEHVLFRQANLTQLYRAKALSLAAEAGSCPILWALAASALRLTAGVSMDWDFISRHTSSYHRSSLTREVHEPGSPSMGLRIYYEETFKIPVPMQILAEQAILQYDYDHPILADLISRQGFEMFAFVNLS